MASNANQMSCHADGCGTSVDIFKCIKCDRVFCFTHLQAHREETQQQLHNIQHRLNELREKLTHLKHNPVDHPLMQSIDKWMNDSIIKVKRVADDATKSLSNFLTNHMSNMEDESGKLFTAVATASKTNQFDETHIKEWSEQLNKLKETIDQPPCITICEDPTALIKPIRICYNSKCILCHESGDFNSSSKIVT